MIEYQYWAHARSGERYHVRIVDGVVTGATGPLHHSEVTVANLGNFHDDDEPDLADDIRDHADEYRRVEVATAGPGQ